MRALIFAAFLLLAVPCNPVPSPSTALTFRAKSIDVFCTRQRDVCCAGLPFDMATCKAILFTGYEFSGMQLDSPGVNQSNIAINGKKAAACLAGLASEACDDTGIPASQLQAITRDCFAAYKGLVPLGGACAADIECTSGNYCEAGLCTPLRTIGQSCHSTDPHIGTNCSTRGSGDTGLYCGPGGTCAPLLGNGAACIVNAHCSSGSCDPLTLPPKCGAAHTDPALCSYFDP